MPMKSRPTPALPPVTYDLLNSTTKDIQRDRATTPGKMNMKHIPPLAQETRVTVDTNTAAHHLNRKPQTLRGWACREDGPIRPRRVYGRLAWSVNELRQLVGCTA